MLYPPNPDGNNRSIQEVRDRLVYYFDATKNCMPKKKKEKPMEGHYEKVPKKMTQFIFVPGQIPSGIDGAFVVSEDEAKGIERKEKKGIDMTA